MLHAGTHDTLDATKHQTHRALNSETTHIPPFCPAHATQNISIETPGEKLTPVPTSQVAPGAQVQLHRQPPPPRGRRRVMLASLPDQAQADHYRTQINSLTD